MPEAEGVLLTGCTVVDCVVPGERFQEAAVLVRDKLIEAVDAAGALEERVRRGAHGPVRTVRLHGAYVLPALWDAHVHLGDVVPPHVAAYADEPPGAHMVRCVRKAQDNLRAGITSVRSLGERFDHDIVLRDAIASGVLAGPRILASGDVAWSAAAVGPEQFRREVRRMARLGVDQVKLLGSGGIPTRSGGGIATPFIGRDELSASCEEAARWNLPVVLHAMGDDTISLGIEFGVRSIEHAFAMSPAIVKALSASRTALCPNLVVTESWDPAWMEAARLPEWMVRNAAEARRHHHAAVREAIAAGVTILAGADDLPQPDGPVGIEQSAGRIGLVRELELLVSLGMRREEALIAATRNPARVTGRDDDLGTVEAGKLADLLVVAGDPLADLRVLEHPVQVWKGGELVFTGAWQEARDSARSIRGA